MITLLLGFSLLIVIAGRTFNYGRWAGRQGNRKGALGLYLFSLLVIIIPLSVFYLNSVR